MRLPHCTGTFTGHSPSCDRDGEYCSLASSHMGPCEPHGSPRDGIRDHRFDPNDPTDPDDAWCLTCADKGWTTLRWDHIR